MIDLGSYGAFLGGAVSGILSGYVSSGLGFPKSAIVHWLGSGFVGVAFGQVISYLPPQAFVLQGVVGGVNAYLAYQFGPVILRKTFKVLGILRDDEDHED